MNETRREWIDRMLRIVGKVLDNLAEGKLRERMPLSFHE